MNSVKTIKTLDGVIAVQLLFSIWTGRKTLKDGDLSLNGETPPKEIISLGSKHTTDPKALNNFSALKRRAERLCLSVGISFMGGYAIPVSKADYINEELHKIVDLFNMKKEAYLMEHESIQAGWISKYPEYESVLTKALTPVSEVKGRINASFGMFRMQSIDSEVTMSSGLEPQVEQMSGTLDEDILKESSKILTSFNNAMKPCQTNVNSVKKLREKVEGLAFLNGKYNNLTKEIIKVENKISTVGVLNFEDRNQLSGLLYRMSSVEGLNELMTQVNSETVETVETESTFFSPSDFTFEEEEFTFEEEEFVIDEDDFSFEDFNEPSQIEEVNKSTFF